nr:retrovirus-related Pol polyprotein from transposon TNT 1-94 [Tanacetum cinerariifolium]
LTEAEFEEQHAEAETKEPHAKADTGEQLTEPKIEQQTKTLVQQEPLVLNPRRSTRSSIKPSWLKDFVTPKAAMAYSVPNVLIKEKAQNTNTLSPVAKAANVRVLIVIATAKEWHLHQLDVNNAFLHEYVKEDIYMKPPEDYSKAAPGKVCKLSKSFYGLKQALRQWNHELSKFLVSLGFGQSKHDYSLFVKDTGDTFISSLVYVDDMLVT